MIRFLAFTAILSLSITPALLLAEEPERKLVKAPESDQHYTVTELGYLEAKDAFVTRDDGVYAFVVYSRVAKDGSKSELLIRSNLVTGTSWTPEKGKKMAADLERKGKSMRTWGSPFTAKGPEDARKIEYRFHQKAGKPKQIEVFAVVRTSDRKPTPAKSLIVAWPFPTERPDNEPSSE